MKRISDAEADEHLRGILLMARECRDMPRVSIPHKARELHTALQAERQRVNELEALIRQGCDGCVHEPDPIDLCSDEARCEFAPAREAVEG